MSPSLTPTIKIVILEIRHYRRTFSLPVSVLESEPPF